MQAGRGRAPPHILRRALESHPTYVWAYSNLGAALMLKGLEDVARKIFECKLKHSARFRPGAGQYRGPSRLAPVVYGAIECLADLDGVGLFPEMFKLWSFKCLFSGLYPNDIKKNPGCPVEVGPDGMLNLHLPLEHSHSKASMGSMVSSVKAAAFLWPPPPCDRAMLPTSAASVPLERKL